MRVISGEAERESFVLGVLWLDSVIDTEWEPNIYSLVWFCTRSRASAVLSNGKGKVRWYSQNIQLCQKQKVVLSLVAPLQLFNFPFHLFWLFRPKLLGCHSKEKMKVREVYSRRLVEPPGISGARTICYFVLGWRGLRKPTEVIYFKISVAFAWLCCLRHCLFCIHLRETKLNSKVATTISVVSSVEI